MGSAKVSASFNKFLSKNNTVVQEAKKAENTMMTCKMPIGWKGHAVCVDGVADKGKDRKDDKGNTQEGNEYVRLDFNVVNDEHFAGAKFSVAWSFYDSEKATAGDRFTWMLNEMENLGLPRQIRESEDTSMEDILEYFIKADAVYDCEVVHNSYRRGDQKEVKVRKMDTVATDINMSPDAVPTSSLTVGQDVKYMGKSWELVLVDGEELTIKSKTTGSTRVIKSSDVE